MNVRFFSKLVACAAILLAVAIQAPAFAQEKEQINEKKNELLRDLEPAEQSKVMSQLGALPLGFVFNHGQNVANVQFEARGAGGSVAMLKGGVVLSLPVNTGTVAKPASKSIPIGVQFLGAENGVHLKASKPLRGKNNFFYGNDKKKWNTGVSTFADITYEGLYSGIDLLYNGTTGRLKGTYKVAPGSDPSDIRWTYVGAKSVAIDAKGDIVLGLSDESAGVGGVVREEAPVAWQVIDGVKKPVAVSFVLNEKNEASFKLGEYDNKYELVIDPFVIFSTLMGGNGTDHTIHLQMDLEGHIYVCGRTHSNPAIMGFGPGWPVTAGSFDPTYNGEIADAFVMKLDKSGTFQHWSGYLGGGDPIDFLITGGADWAFDIQLSANGDVHVVGFTEAANFPVTANAMQSTKVPSAADSFYTIISADGSQIVYSTFLGGSGFDFAYGLALRDNGWAYIVGWTDSDDFPTTTNCYQSYYGGLEDGFFTVINPGSASPIYSTFIGDATSNIIYDVAIGPFDLAFLGGETFSTFDLSLHPTIGNVNVAVPINRGGKDGFMAIMDPGNNGFSDLLYASYLGGTGDDYIYALDVDKNTGEVYMTGETNSLNFPLLNSQFLTTGTSDTFLTKMYPQGLGLFDFKYSIVFGSNQYDAGLDIVQRNGTAFYSGISEIVPGNHDAFWVRFGPTGAIEDGALYGVSYYEMSLGIAVNDTGVTTCGYSQCINGEVNFTNCMSPIPFPLVNPFLANYGGGSGDGWVRKRSLN
ncbi:MAG: hypothetical protein ACI97A_000338 [Planctomycetota bacterium]|jgi:hypothetical protein